MRAASQRRGHSRQPAQPAQPARSAAVVSELDRYRYRLFRAGMSIAEIATRERVGVKAVDQSILRVRIEISAYSSEETDMATRKVFVEKLPEAALTISEAMQAKSTVDCLIVEHDPETGETTQVKGLTYIPDHATRLQAVGALRQLLQAVQPKVPLVNVNAPTQNNFALGQGQQPAQLSQPTSAEAIIRAIRAERGLALTDGASTVTVEGNALAVVEKDEELEDDLEGDDDDDNEKVDEEGEEGEGAAPEEPAEDD
jgi:hypothetical protein